MNYPAELSKELALALGYYPESVRQKTRHWCDVYRYSKTFKCEMWTPFDYRDPSVALAMVELLLNSGMHPAPSKNCDIFWFTGRNLCVKGNTLAEAAARAVMALKGKA